MLPARRVRRGAGRQLASRTRTPTKRSSTGPRSQKITHFDLLAPDHAAPAASRAATDSNNTFVDFRKHFDGCCSEFAVIQGVAEIDRSNSFVEAIGVSE